MVHILAEKCGCDRGIGETA